ncbi:MAG: invasion protein IalB [Halocynthiibacter sp.]|jgi:invasion protein IalB
MNILSKSAASLALFAAMSASAFAQDTATTAPVTETAPATEAQSTPPKDAAEILSMGTEVTDPNEVGTSYTLSTHGDWELRCIKAAEGQDPCNLYQLLKEADGNPVAEISLFKLPDGGQAEAGATIITPLETLLTEQVTLSVDGGKAKRYPFTFCGQIGCFARIGLTGADIASFKAGSAAKMYIVPIAAPDQKIEIAISLSGFTAGYAAVSEANAPKQ